MALALVRAPRGAPPPETPVREETHHSAQPPADGNPAAEDEADSTKPAGEQQVLTPGTPRPDLPEIADLTEASAREAYAEKLRIRQEEAYRAARERAEDAGWPTRTEIDGVVHELYDFDEERGPRYRITYNLNAGVSTAADQVRQNPPHNDGGTGVVVGVWDEGQIRATHQEFGGRIAVIDNVALSPHATHVGGTIGAAGVQSNALGMSPKVNIVSYDWNSDLAEMATAGRASPAQTDKIQISNHSYGFPAGWVIANYAGPTAWHWLGTWGAQESDWFGQYDDTARDLDEVIYNTPYYLPVVAAGNERDDTAPSAGTTFYYWNGGWQSKSYTPATDPTNDNYKAGGYDTLPLTSNAKNPLLIGAVNDAVSGGARSPASATMLSFSSWGPTDDGRIKPDIVANGASLYSPVSSGDASYGTSSGTSMASPNAAGSAALLQELYGNRFPGASMRAATLKALILHAADDLANPGPDYRVGWGLMNTKAAADLIHRHADFPEYDLIREDDVSNVDPMRTYTFVREEANTNPVRVTIAWTDPPGPIRTGLNNTNLVLINDLDLRVIDPLGVTNFPYVLDPANFTANATNGDNFRDNVEQVHIADATNAGTYRVVVSIKGAVSNHVQHFSMIADGFSAAPAIEHEPHPNTTNTATDYAIDAVITPDYLLNTNELWIAWSTDDAPETFTTNLMSRLSNDTWRAEIPAQDVNTTVHYSIHARATNGLAARHPADAPDSRHSFLISGPVSLLIDGDPDIHGEVTPEYGEYTYASGNVVQAAAPFFTVPAGGERDALAGYTGAGSVPPDEPRRDEAAHYAAWTNGSNGGAGFEPWELSGHSDAGSFAGFFLGDSTAGTGDINSANTNAFGMYANPAPALARAVRRFAGGELREGHSFSIDIAVNFRNGHKGIILLNGDTILFNFNVGELNGQDAYFYELNGNGNRFDTGWSYDAQSVISFLFTQGTGTVMTIRMERGADLIELEAALAARPDRTQLYTSRTTGGGSDNDLYFNHLEINRPNEVRFIIEEDSELVWHWQRQYALTQTSTVAGIIDAVTWWDDAATAQTVTAPFFTLFNGTNFAFAEWRVDDVRQEDGLGIAVNPATDIVLSAPAFASALYLPAGQDTDGAGLPDWWQIHYFGSLGVDAGVDSDGDGFTELDEYRDGTNPKDDEDVPQPPAIQHSPLAEPQSAPAPWTVTAEITDNHIVANATLWWNRNSTGWESAPLELGEAENIYTNAIPAGTNGDHLVYYVVAEDDLGLASTNGPHEFLVRYAVMQVAPTNDQSFIVQPLTGTNFSIAIENFGNTNLGWEVRLIDSLFSDDMESGTNGWSAPDPGLWHLTTNRSYSGQFAWYAGNSSIWQYNNGMFDWLVSPPVTVYDGTTLTINHWIKSELLDSTYAWDGGVVAVSTNGADFIQIAPEGGYPYLMQGHSQSPFEHNTPVFAGTGGWQIAVFDLSAWAMQEVQIAFIFGSDGFVVDEGWYIDDVVLGTGTHTNEWISAAPTSGVAVAGSSTSVVVSLDALTTPSGEDRTTLLRVIGNDPVSPERTIPVRMQVRSPPQIDISFAGQTSTDGSGRVTTTNEVFDADPEWLEIEYRYSTDQGDTWLAPWIQSATATLGAPAVTNAPTNQVRNVQTGALNDAATNTLSVVWATHTNLPPPTLTTGTLIRARAFDGIFWSDPVTSAFFMVDNEPPAPPPALWSSSHTQTLWSANSMISIEWTAADDGDGIGLAGYSHIFTNDMTSAPSVVITGDLDAESPDLGEGTNWWAGVRSFDVFGNRSATTNIGPFYIDLTAPAATGAVVIIPQSAFGSYTLDGALTNTWAGFSDNLSGIDGYYFGYTNHGGTANGNWTTDLSGILPDAAPDQTNTVFVWAQDIAGNIGAAASAGILVLDPDGDWDGNGLSNLQEEIAGTDAADPASVFMLDPDASADDEGFILRWPWITNRVYTVLWLDTNSLVPPLDWNAITNPPYGVTNAWAIWLDTNTPLNGTRYYWITVERDE